MEPTLPFLHRHSPLHSQEPLHHLFWNMTMMIYILTSHHDDADNSGNGSPMPVIQPSDPSKRFPFRTKTVPHNSRLWWIENQFLIQRVLQTRYFGKWLPLLLLRMLLKILTTLMVEAVLRSGRPRVLGSLEPS